MSTCPICAEERASLVCTSEGVRVVRCANCSLLRSVDSGVPRLDEYFSTEYIADDERLDDFIGLRRSALRRVARTVRLLRPSGGDLLDVGSASGEFLSCFAGDPAWRAVGIEPSAHAAEFCTRLGLDVRRGFLADCRFAYASFDVVTSLDTFSFHPEPATDVDEFRRVLKPGGLLVFEIPGLRLRLLKNTGIVARVLHGTPAKLNAGLHRYFYDRRTLGLLVGKHGFEFVCSRVSYPPSYRRLAARIAARGFFDVTRLLYAVTGGRANYAQKEMVVFRKRP